MTPDSIPDAPPPVTLAEGNVDELSRCSGARHSEPAVRAGHCGHEDVEQRVQVNIPLSRKRYRQPSTDLVPVASSDPIAIEITGLDEISDDPLCCSLGDLNICGDVAYPNPGVIRDAQQRQPMICQEVERSHAPKHI